MISESCGALFGMEDVCELAWNEVPVFKTGRRDCIPDPTLGAFTNYVYKIWLLLTTYPPPFTFSMV